MRAPTPTGAAELAVPNLVDLNNYLEQLKIRTRESIQKKVNYQKLVLDSLKSSYVIKSPMIMYESKKQKLDTMLEKINTLIFNQKNTYVQKLDYIKNNHIFKNPTILYKDKMKELNILLEKLELVSPMHVIKRGYSIVLDHDNKVISSVKNIKSKDKIKIRLSNGIVDAEVLNVTKEDNNGKAS